MAAADRSGSGPDHVNAILAALIAAALVAIVIFRRLVPGRKVPAAIAPGLRLPEFAAVDEDGNAVTSTDLRGAPAVLLFVRGSWCPFCTKQVKILADHYKAINDAGARLILITPKPLETTRRVADFFEVDFEFWLDASLHIAKALGLLMENAVPGNYAPEYGSDSVWPTAIVADADGIIRHTQLSRFIADRPNPEKLLRIVREINVPRQ